MQNQRHLWSLGKANSAWSFLCFQQWLSSTKHSLATLTTSCLYFKQLEPFVPEFTLKQSKMYCAVCLCPVYIESKPHPDSAEIISSVKLGMRWLSMDLRSGFLVWELLQFLLRKWFLKNSLDSRILKALWGTAPLSKAEVRCCVCHELLASQSMDGGGDEAPESPQRQRC